MPMRSLEQWLAHQEKTHPHSIDLGLERLMVVLERLRWRQPTVPVITVAGTNGKGSVVAHCAAMLAAAGHRVGAFTSPHLRDYRERIRVNDAEVGSETLMRAFERIEQACTDSAHDPVSLTFFEYNALAALLIFEAAQLDAWVLEIGMGGRLDAVNVVDPSVAVVVSIGLDHQEFLGPTLDGIAREKAGIFRAGTPAVLGSEGMPAVLTTMAQEIGAPLKRLGIEYTITRHAERWRYRGPRWDLTNLPPPSLLGDTQFRNAAAAIAALEELEPRLALPAAALARGLSSVRLVGRFQVIAAAGRPTWILDVAHNPDAAGVLASNLRARPITGRTLAVCGILADKDAAGVARQLRDCIDEWWLSSTEGARGTTSAALAAKIAPQIAVRLNESDNIAAACAAVASAARPEDRIVVFGSFHTVGPAMDWLEARGILPPPRLPEYTAPPNDHE
ncbi:MAG: bifunctional tetrahydrofolate synthase/dihydrofolate synthase [Steroidobacteraceae bacterium]